MALVDEQTSFFRFCVSVADPGQGGTVRGALKVRE